ncbi:MAG: DoxX family protein [Chitinophagaceae bacterium]
MKIVPVYIMAILYIAAGAMHFLKSKGYERIMPPWLPWPLLLVYITGAAEILLGILLLPASSRMLAAWGIIVLLILVFPANVQMMMNYFNYNKPTKWLMVLRLPLQLVLIWWAWLYTRK